MKRTLTIVSLLALAACTATAPRDEGDVTNDDTTGDVMMAMEGASGVDNDASSISFIGKSSIIDHPGTFETFTITLTGADDDFTKGTLEAVVDVTSVKTNSDGVDGHFQREDFFNTAVYPEATFRSTAIVANDKGAYDITGNLTMKGVTHPITFMGTPTKDGMVLTADVPRKEFDIAKDTYGEKLLDANVPVTVTLVFTR